MRRLPDSDHCAFKGLKVVALRSLLPCSVNTPLIVAISVQLVVHIIGLSALVVSDVNPVDHPSDLARRE